MKYEVMALSTFVIDYIREAPTHSWNERTSAISNDLSVPFNGGRTKRALVTTVLMVKATELSLDVKVNCHLDGLSRWEQGHLQGPWGFLHQQSGTSWRSSSTILWIISRVGKGSSFSWSTSSCLTFATTSGGKSCKCVIISVSTVIQRFFFACNLLKVVVLQGRQRIWKCVRMSKMPDEGRTCFKKPFLSFCIRRKHTGPLEEFVRPDLNLHGRKQMVRLIRSLNHSSSVFRVLLHDPGGFLAFNV